MYAHVTLHLWAGAKIGSNPNGDVLYLMPDGTVMVDYGRTKIPIPVAQYKANGYRPPFYTVARDDKARNSAAGEAGLEDRLARVGRKSPRH